MGRHAADRREPGSAEPDDRRRAAGPRLPLHADLFAPTPGSAAARVNAERAEQAVSRVVEPHRADLRAYILRFTDGDEVVAETILKETFYRAAQEPARLPRRPSAVRPWLALVARNVLRDGERYAPAGHDDRPPPPVHEERPPAPSIPATTIAAAMEDLPAMHRELIVQLFYGGVSLEAAAAERGLPVRAIKSRLRAAMRALRSVLDQHMADGQGAR